MSTGTEYGSWEIHFDGVEPNDTDLEYIANQIRSGFTSGEMVQDSEEE